MFKKTAKSDQLNEEIARVHAHMTAINPTSDEYNTMSEQLQKLYAMQNTRSDRRVSPDTLIMAGANLVGIAMIVGHERAHVLTSKAMSFVSRMN